MKKRVIIRSIILLIMLFGVSSSKAFVATDTSINNHVIIAFDVSLNQVKKNLLCSGGEVQRSLKNIVQKYRLLNDSCDYYSFVNFSVGRDIIDFKDFVKPSLDKKGNAIAWIPFTNFKMMFSQHGRWDDIAYFQGCRRAADQGYGPFPLLTGAKQFSLLSVANTKNGKYANRTYIAMVTDNWYAGMDNYQKEFLRVFEGKSVKQKPKFDAYYGPITSIFKFTELCSEPIDGNNDGNYRVYLYEVKPTTNIALSSIVDYPADLGLHRVKGGYRIDFNYQSVDPMYRVERIEVTLKDNNGNITTAISDDNNRIFSKEVIETSRLPHDSVNMTIRGWIHQNDTLYGGLLMNPYDSEYPRLNLTLRIPIAKEATVFGFPLLDTFWWWFPNNAKHAALLWELLIVLILLTLLVFILRKLLLKRAIFIPEDSSIKLSKLD